MNQERFRVKAMYCMYDELAHYIYISYFDAKCAMHRVPKLRREEMRWAIHQQ